MKMGANVRSILMMLVIWVCMAVVWLMLIYIENYAAFGGLVCLVFAVMLSLLYALMRQNN